MPGSAPIARRGRRGLRTAQMVRLSQERISDLFGLAEAESRDGQPALADRYVELARRIGMRYNIRLLREYRDLYCRACNSFWVPGRTLRVRFRRGRRVQTCEVCGQSRRLVLRTRPTSPSTELGSNRARLVADPVMVGEEPGDVGMDDEEEL